MRKVRVLIVDDEIEFASTLAERLELRDFEAEAVTGADDAVARMQGGSKPDVVVLDLKMPGIDGLATLSLLKREDPKVEAILLTGHGSTKAAIEGMQRGLFDYLMKPVDIADLVQRIRNAAEKKRASSSR